MRKVKGSSKEEKRLIDTDNCMVTARGGGVRQKRVKGVDGGGRRVDLGW